MKSVSEINTIVKEILPEIIAFRQDLHHHPEIGWEEFRTTEKIDEFLKKYDLGSLRKPLPTGGFLDYIFNPEAPVVLLRADIDALPLQDLKTVSFKSANDGICHACGHDAHTAIVLGVAAALKISGLALPFNLRFVFQPAEEPIPSGAPEMVKANVLDGVICSLGLHMDPRLPLGTISLTEGWVNMQSIRLDFKFTGTGGHSARPYETQDIIWLATRMIQDTYQMVYREFNWMDNPVMLTYTRIRSGEAYNVIPDALELTGTLRLASSESKTRFYQKMTGLINYLENESGIKIHLDKTEGAPPVINDPVLIRVLKETIDAAEEEITIVEGLRSPGGDDFSYYAQSIPGAMIRFGIMEGGNHPALHTGHFDVPEKVLEIGIKFFLNRLRSLNPDAVS